MGCGPTRAADLKTAFTQASAISGTSVTLTAGCTYTMTWDGTSQASVDGSPTIFGTLSNIVTINGNGATVERADDMQYARFFYIAPGGRLNLNDLTLRRGTSRGDDGQDASPTGDSNAQGGLYSGLGGAIYNDGQLIADAVTFEGNSAIGGNGGCSQNGGTGGAGGAGLGGAIFSTGLALDVARSTFSGNVALGGSAGSYGCSTPHVTGAAGGGGGGMGGAGAYDDLSGSTGTGTNAGYGGGGGGAMFLVPNSGGDGGFGGGAGGNNASAGEFGTAAAVGGFAGGSGGGLGGAVFVESVPSGGYALLVNDSFSGNSAMGADSTKDGPNGGWGVGGAVFLHQGSVSMSGNTLAGNNASGGDVTNPANAQDGGSAKAAGIFVDSTASLVQSQTIVTSGVLLAGTTTNGSAGSTADPDISGAIASQGYNLVTTRGSSSGYVGTDLADSTPALLSALGNHGGPTLTFEPLPGSAAIDAMPTGVCTLTQDQRGYPRPFGGACDIGSVEVSDIIFANGFD